MEDRDYLQEHLDWMEHKIAEAEYLADQKRDEEMLKQWEKEQTNDNAKK